MLRACRILLRPGGTLAFTTIHLPDGLSRDERRRAVAAGPRAVAHRRDHRRMLADAGFDDVRHQDVTAQFRQSAQDWLDASERHAVGLREAVGAATFAERQTTRRDLIQAVDAGLLRRSLYWARVRSGGGR